MLTIAQLVAWAVKVARVAVIPSAAPAAPVAWHTAEACLPWAFWCSTPSSATTMVPSAGMDFLVELAVAPEELAERVALEETLEAVDSISKVEARRSVEARLRPI